MVTKKHTNRATAAEESIDGYFFNRRHANTAADSNRHIRLNILAIIPGLLDTDEWHRDMVIHYLCAQYPGEVKAGLASSRGETRPLLFPVIQGKAKRLGM